MPVRSFQLGQPGEGRVRPATRAERGQALVVIAMAMIGLLAFVGLMVDAGILFIAQGHLRRAVDAAALAAAGQFRVGRNSSQLLQSAEEVVHLNGVDPVNLTLGICSPGDPTASPPIPPDPLNDPSLCPQSGPRRKLVKVTATNEVRFAFLGIIGIPSTQIVADSVSETASVDVVLVIDTSNSMTFDAPRGAYTDTTNMWWPDHCNTATPSDPADAAAGFTGNCHPFLEVKKAASNFISHLYYPYDRLSIVTFDVLPDEVEPITNTDKPDRWQNIVKTLNVSEPRDPFLPITPPECKWTDWGTDPSGCTNTSTGGALTLAGSQFGKSPIRQESVWVVILLTDGAANASYVNPVDQSIINRFCPSSTWFADANHFDPFCRAADKTTRHTLVDPTHYNQPGFDPGHTTTYNPQNSYNSSNPQLNYDADDYARDSADFVACAPKYAQAAKWCRDSLDYTINQGGQGALIYTIGLGKLVIDNSQGGGVANPDANNGEARIDPSDPHAGYAAGDTLLRYIARVGLTGDPNGTDPCAGVAPPPLTPFPIPPTPTPQPPPSLPPGNLSYNCGNYYFSQTGTGLNAVFQSIASRIFTRLTQ